jgi:hypothetical protein
VKRRAKRKGGKNRKIKEMAGGEKTEDQKYDWQMNRKITTREC